MSPQTLCRRLWLDQSAFSSVVTSTSSRPFHGPRRRMSAILMEPMKDPAAACRRSRLCCRPTERRQGAGGLEPVDVAPQQVPLEFMGCHNTGPGSWLQELVEGVGCHVGAEGGAAAPADDASEWTSMTNATCANNYSQGPDVATASALASRLRRDRRTSFGEPLEPEVLNSSAKLLVQGPGRRREHLATSRVRCAGGRPGRTPPRLRRRPVPAARAAPGTWR